MAALQDRDGLPVRTRAKNGAYVAAAGGGAAPPAKDDGALVADVERAHVAAQQLFGAARYDEAAEAWLGALRLVRTIGDPAIRKGVQPVLAGALGCALDCRGDPRAAVTWHARAFEANGKIGDTRAQGGDMANAGTAYLNAAAAAAAAGDDAAALVASARECFELAARIGADCAFPDVGAKAAAGLERCAAAGRPAGAAAGDGAATGIAGVRAAARSEVRRDRGGVAGPPSPPTGIMRRGRPSKRL